MSRATFWDICYALIRAVLLCLRPLDRITYHINLSPNPLISSFLCDRNKFFTLTRGPNLEKGGAPSTHKWIQSPSCSVGASQVYIHDLCLSNSPDSLCLLLPTVLHSLVTPYIHHRLCYSVHFSVFTFISPNITLCYLNTSFPMSCCIIVRPYINHSLLSFLTSLLSLIVTYIILYVSHSLLSSLPMFIPPFMTQPHHSTTVPMKEIQQMPARTHSVDRAHSTY